MMFTQKKLILISLTVLLCIVGLLIFVYQGVGQKQSTNQVAFLLSPVNTTKSIGEQFEVKLSVDSKTYDVSGIDMVLSFDKNNVELISFKSAGVFNDLLANKPDNISGTFKLIATKSTSNRVSGVIEVGTLTFRGKAVGTSSVLFQNPLVTVSGVDQYIQTANNSIGQYTIKGGT